MIRTILVDDHEMFRNGLRALLASDAEIDIVGEAADGATLLEMAGKLKPDVVCMDVGMPKIDGIEATRQLVGKCPGVKVVGVSSHVDRGCVTDMLNAGAVGYVAKSSAADELRRAIRAVCDGRNYLCPNVLEVITQSLRDGGEPIGATHARLAPRERQVLKLIAEGLRSSEIAARLNITTGTVDVHRRNIMHKLELRGIAELTKYAIRTGLITEHE